MSLLQRLLSQSTVIFGARLFGAGLTFLVQVAIARFFGGQALGDYILVMATVNIVAVVMPLDADCHRIGINVAERYGFSIYDSMIVAAALQAGCDILYSEDMQHHQLIEGSLTVINPYL